MQVEVNFRVPFFLLVAAAVVSMVVVPVPASSGKKPVQIDIGTRRAATALLTGTFPKRWAVRAGGSIPPKSLTWPIPGHHLGRGFGSDHGRHLAMDITAPVGTKVHAAEQGIVGYADDGVKGYGKLMMIVHPGGWVTLYAHLSRFKAKPGQLISRGQVVALTGNTGISKGPHLHTALLVDGTPVDPMRYMKNVPQHNVAQLFFFQNRL
jgi:murein DD-endopeptidase MepM/ murein hydrolase activator NlpD